MQEAQRIAALVVDRVLGGATLPSALAAIAPPEDDARGRRRSLVQELAYGTLRHWGTLDALVRMLAAKPFGDPTLGQLVAVALYQLEHTHAPPFAVVDHAVNAAATIARPAAKPLVNALLRRYLREREALNRAVAGDPIARWSHPRWWIERVRHDHPDHWESILEAGNSRPTLALRVNRRVGTRDDLRGAFAAAGIEAEPVGASGLVVSRPRPVQGLPGYAEGAFSVQDLGAQLAAPLLCVETGQRVLDACAAPGGKTTHLVELDDLDLTALDADETRLARVRDNLARLQLADRGVRVICRRRRRFRCNGGTAGRSTAFSRMFPARRPASCAAIPMASGCAAKAMLPASRGSRPASWTRCGPVLRPAASCSTQPARSSGTRTKPR